MKIWGQLTETQQQRAAHSYQHQVIDSFISEGFLSDPQTDEQKAEFLKVQESLAKIKNLETYEEKMDACFEDETLFNVTLHIAVELAQDSYFIESGENALFLEEIDDYFEDEDGDEMEDELLDNVELPDDIVGKMPRSKKKHSLN